MAELGAEGAEAAEGVEILEGATEGMTMLTEGLAASAGAQGGVDVPNDVALAGAAVVTGILTGVGAIVGAVTEGSKEKKQEEQIKKIAEQREKRKKEEEAKKILILKGKIKKNIDNLEEFVKDTPEIGTDESLTGQGYYPGDRLTYLRYHENAYKDDPDFKEISNVNRFKVAPVGYQIQEEQIRYIYNNLNIYKDYIKTPEGHDYMRKFVLGHPGTYKPDDKFIPGTRIPYPKQTKDTYTPAQQQVALDMYGIKNAKPSDIPDGFYDVVYDLTQDMKINQNQNVSLPVASA